MAIQKILFLPVALFLTVQSRCSIPLAEEFKQTGYREILNTVHTAETFDSLYACFDDFIKFFQADHIWAHKLYIAKERFIRSKQRNYYSTDFFGFYDESERKGRDQISFYYSTHFHEFVYSYYPEFNQIPQINRFFTACFEIQKEYSYIFSEAADELGLKTVFSSGYNSPPLLFKVIKYLPSYVPAKPHYDGTVFSLFLDSTDNQSLLLSPYKLLFTVDDFSSPLRLSQRNSLLLIPGTLLAEFSINPTPHIVLQSGKIRYATVAFALRSDYIPAKSDLSLLPNFNH